MYNTDQTLVDRFYNNIQTEANNNDPRPLVYITRNKTAITSQRYWEKVLITPTVGTRSSIAVRRPLGAFMGDMIFTAQVEGGTARIKYAEPKSNLSDMVFTDLTFIPNVSELSIMFDGFMKQSSDEVVETYTIGNLPYVFYVDTSNSLKYINLDDESINGTISDDATNIATVRGLYAESIGMDDGIWCFYTNSLGELWEARILEGEVVELTQITLLPTGVTAWLDVWAGFTFDYRIILQLKGNDEKVYTLMSNSRPSGYSLVETFQYSLKVTDRVMFQCGEEPPMLYSISNSPEQPLNVKLIFDSEVFIFDSSPTKVWIRGADGQKRYPKSITKTGKNEITLTFGNDLIGLRSPHILECDKYKPCGFGSNGVSAIIDHVTPILFDIDFSNAGNDIFEYVSRITEPLTFEVEIEKIFDGKTYANEILDYTVTMKNDLNLSILTSQFENAYSPQETLIYNIQVKNALTMVLCDIDGVPI